MKADSDSSQFQDAGRISDAEASIQDIVAGFKSNSDRVSDLIYSLVREKKEIAAEVSYAKDRESKLTEEISNLRNVAERMDIQTLKLSDLERKFRTQEEATKLIEDELDAKAHALSQLKTEYKEAVDQLTNTNTENDTLKLRCSDLERKQEQLQEMTESLNIALSDKKRGLAELESKIFEQTGILSETQAKFLDTEETLKKLNEQLLAQGKELKEAKWEALEQQEELRVLKVEFARKSGIIEEREKEIESKAETVRDQQEQVASLEAEVRRALLRNTKNEENIAAASQKISAQSTAIVQLERNLVRTQQELEKKELHVRNLEDKYRLMEEDRSALESELIRFREIVQRSKEVVQHANQRAEDLNSKLNVETRQRVEAIKMRDDIRLELASTREKLIHQQQSLSQLSDINTHLNEQLRLVRGDFESLDSEHKSVLRTEAHQSSELENITEELETKSDLLRELQAQNAGLREKLDIAKMKLDQQSSSADEARRRASKLQDELAVYKKRSAKISVVPQESLLELDELRQNLESKELLIKQQDQLIQVLQNRVGEKRVVSISPRESAPSKNGEDVSGAADDRQQSNLRRY